MFWFGTSVLVWNLCLMSCLFKFNRRSLPVCRWSVVQRIRFPRVVDHRVLLPETYRLEQLPIVQPVARFLSSVRSSTPALPIVISTITSAVKRSPSLTNKMRGRDSVVDPAEIGSHGADDVDLVGTVMTVSIIKWSPRPSGQGSSRVHNQLLEGRPVRGQCCSPRS